MAQTGCRINIRLYHDKSNMRTFKKFAIEEFPIFKEVIAAKMCLIDTYQNEFRGKLSVETLELGYVGYSNAKHKITNEKGLEVGYESKKHHKDNCPLFYIAEIQKPSIDTSKRKATSIKVDSSSSEEDVEKTPKPKKAKKKKSESERVDEIASRLENENGTNGNWDLSDYRLWAVALDRNLHQSYTEPPKYPHFQKKMNRKDAKTKQTTRTNAETNTTTSRRTELLSQLKTLGDLKKEDVLAEEEFQEQRNIVLQQLKEIN